MARSCLLASALAGLVCCDRGEPHTAAPQKPAPEPAVATLVGASDRFAAILAPLSGSQEAPDWQDRQLRSVAPDSSGDRAAGEKGESHFSLRVYRIERAGVALPLAGLALTLSVPGDSGSGGATRDLAAHDLSIPAGPSPELALVRQKSLGAFAHATLESSSGFEAWIAVDGAVKLEDVRSARFTIGGETFELRPGTLSAERFSAIAARPSREALVAVARSFDPESVRKARAGEPSQEPPR